MYGCLLKCCIYHRASRSFVDVPYMMCLTNPSFSMCVTSMAGACSIWAALPAYTLQVRLFGDPHLAKRSPNYKRIGSVSRRSKGRNCKITSVAYMCSPVPDQAERRWLVSRILRVIGTARRHLWVSISNQHLPGRCTLPRRTN